MAPEDSKIAVEILQSVNNRTQSLRKILRMEITDLVINTLLGRVTLDPAGMHCPWWDDAFVSSFCFFWSRSESGAPCVRGVHSSNKHCVAVYCPISTRFSSFFSEEIALLATLHRSHFVARWWQNFREIGVKNCENPKKSAETFVRTTSYR